MFFIILFICIMLILMNLYFNIMLKKNREKSLPVECGFDPLINKRLPFSINFFLISLVFLIFDVEIVLIMPMIFILKNIMPLISLIMFIYFLFMLLIGLLMEWYLGYLEWLN
uniref:NADH-ubiquinone oxidoreductase chain 3 n=1 Tax=Colletes gigas TaxID=935657 RepID=A0A0U1YGY0_9HYME|nr:NADH dehydrogenase subunit 3 [Colletes gigas]QLI42501.1 NADH dehydrogenase subunit 3 [Colletes gigas]